LTIDVSFSLFTIKSFLKYWLVKEERHSIQSPLVYEIYNRLLAYPKKERNKDLDLEDLRRLLLKDNQLLEIEDFGAGSKKLKNKIRKTSDITKFSTSGRKFSQLYQYFCSLTPAEKVLELGTCVGINARYLARVIQGDFYSLEGAKALFYKAQENNPPENIRFVLGKIQDTLPPILRELAKVDFVLIDATHTYRGTMAYFDMILPYLQTTSIVAIADIHWSMEMNKAWEEIKGNPSVSHSMDFYECGILFFKKGMDKSHYVLHY